MRTDKPKDYWKLINSIDRKRDESPIYMETHLNYMYFKKLNINDIDLTTHETHQRPDPDDQNNVNVNKNSQNLNDPITESEIN